MNNLLQNPKTLGIAIILGILPALFWLWFWLKEDKEDPEPNGLLALCFFVGMLLVLLVIPIQKFIQSAITSPDQQIIGWAAAEELINYGKEPVNS